MSELYELIYKIIILGDASVGKSSLIRRFVFNEFELSIPMTIGYSNYPKGISLGSIKIMLNIWDTAGQERYSSIIPSYFRGSQAAIIVYDITSEKSFKKTNYWISQAKELAGEDIKFMLIGNKADMESSRKVTIKHGIELARSNNMLFFETSCMNSLNVEQAFMELASIIYGKTVNVSAVESDQGIKPNGRGISILVKSNEEKKENKCC